jgi:hypothetical protein
LTFQSSFFMPGMNFTQTNAFASTLFTALNSAGMNITNPYATPASAAKAAALMARDYPTRGAGVMNLRLSSRLLPRENFEDGDLLDATLGAIRNFVVEGGYTLHSVDHCPSMEVAGYPDNAVDLAYRRAALHAQA